MFAEHFRGLVRRFYKQITYMQKRMRDQLTTRGSKVEVLVNYWDKTFGKLQLRASKTKDE